MRTADSTSAILKTSLSGRRKISFHSKSRWSEARSAVTLGESSSVCGMTKPTRVLGRAARAMRLNISAARLMGERSDPFKAFLVLEAFGSKGGLATMMSAPRIRSSIKEPAKRSPSSRYQPLGLGISANVSESRATSRAKSSISEPRRRSLSQSCRSLSLGVVQCLVAESNRSAPSRNGGVAASRLIHPPGICR